MIRITLLIALLAAFPPLATDMYLPAIPHLKAMWNQPLVVVNLTLVCFFLTYCLFMLVYGPISDRFGRRPPLLVGIGIFILGSIMCSLANGVVALIAARILQASGAAAASALSLAMTKDLFEARKRTQVLAQIAVIMALAPMLAPIIGAWVIHYAGWRLVFLVQGTLGLAAWVGVFLIDEPLKRFQQVSPLEAVTVYFRLMRNPRFIGLLLALSLLVLPFFGFIAGSSDVYMSRFGMDERRFGYFFGFNALAAMIGAFLCSSLSRRFTSGSLMTVAFAGIMVSGCVMTLIPHHSPWSLALPMWSLSLFFGISRPPSNNLMLEQVNRDVGSASALIMVTFMTFGAFSMGVISLAWTDKITVLGILGGVVGAATLTFWLIFRRRFVPA